MGMEVLTTGEMERADRLAIAAGTPGFALMLSAGQAVAAAAMDMAEEGAILVIAGPGNNGGDGFVAAAELAAHGREVQVILLCERDSLQGDAASAARDEPPLLETQGGELRLQPMRNAAAGLRERDRDLLHSHVGEVGKAKGHVLA